MTTRAERVRMRHRIDLTMLGIKAGFDPRQLRDPHSGEWVDIPGTGVSLEDALAWIASGPKGSWGAILAHGTSLEAAAAIRAGGFDMDLAAPDGEFGPGIYFTTAELSQINTFGPGEVQAAVRLEKPATPEIVNEVRGTIYEAMGGGDGVAKDPLGFKRRFLAEMRRRGYDGATSDREGRVTAVYDPKAIVVLA